MFLDRPILRIKDKLEFTRKYEEEFLEKMKLLSNSPATKYTRASEFVEQIAMETKKMLNSEEAYQTDEGIFLSIISTLGLVRINEK